MTLPVLTEKRGRGFYMVSEANGHRSREEITIEDGVGVLAVGTVLGKVTATGEYKQVDLAANTGEEVAAGVLYDEVDATDSAVPGVAHVRDAEVNGNELVYPTGASNNDIADINAALADIGIIVRT